MRLIGNNGNGRVIDELHRSLSEHSSLDVASPSLSLFAFAGLRPLLDQLQRCRLVVPLGNESDLRLQGTEADRPSRNQLHARALAKQCAQWISSKADVRPAPATLPQSTILASQPDSASGRAITGNCPLTTEGLGLAPGNQMNDLEYRRTQLLKLQDAVIDLEDLSSGVSIADLTLTDFRIDLAQSLKAHPGQIEALPVGTFGEYRKEFAATYVPTEKVRAARAAVAPASPS